MALELRPNCKYCDRDLPANSTAAWICSYECTFFADCVDDVGPYCGGGFVLRPIRPAHAWRRRTLLALRPFSTKRGRFSHAPNEIAAFVREIESIPPQDR